MQHHTSPTKRSSTEVSEKFKNLMDKIRQRKWDEIRDPMVHPYSFIRNILWMHTFLMSGRICQLNHLSESIDIPDDVVSEVFGKPEYIDETSKE